MFKFCCYFLIKSIILSQAKNSRTPFCLIIFISYKINELKVKNAKDMHMVILLVIYVFLIFYRYKF